MSRNEAQFFFNAYRDAFNRGDGDAVADLWHTPSSISHPGKQADLTTNTAWMTDETMRSNHRALCDIYAKRGPHSWGFDLLNFVPLGADQGFANLHWVCRSSDGEEMANFGTGYLLIRTTSDVHGIRVVHVAQYDESSTPAERLTD